MGTRVARHGWRAGKRTETGEGAGRRGAESAGAAPLSHDTARIGVGEARQAHIGRGCASAGRALWWPQRVGRRGREGAMTRERRRQRQGGVERLVEFCAHPGVSGRGGLPARCSPFIRPISARPNRYRAPTLTATYGLCKRIVEAGLEDDLSYYLDRIDRVVVPNLVTLIAAFRSAGAPVLYPLRLAGGRRLRPDLGYCHHVGHEDQVHALRLHVTWVDGPKVFAGRSVGYRWAPHFRRA